MTGWSDYLTGFHEPLSSFTPVWKMPGTITTFRSNYTSDIGVFCHTFGIVICQHAILTEWIWTSVSENAVSYMMKRGYWEISMHQSEEIKEKWPSRQRFSKLLSVSYGTLWSVTVSVSKPGKCTLPAVCPLSYRCKSTQPCPVLCSFIPLFIRHPSDITPFASKI